jgi:hypothetical protein
MMGLADQLLPNILPAIPPMAAVKDNFKKFLLSSEFLFSMAQGFIGYMVS